VIIFITGLVDVGNSLFVRVLNSIGELGRSEWNAVLGSCDADGLMIGDAAVVGSTQPSTDMSSLSTVCPFLHYDWIQALEESGCASTRAGNLRLAYE
jgi:predicted N-acyltransferase